MRPTIPVGPWRLAINLEETREISSGGFRPADSCTCIWCRNWGAAWQQTLPTALTTQLHRVCIDPARPSDLYPSTEAGSRFFLRVTFHCVGQVLSGPSLFRADPKLGRIRLYEVLAQDPYLSLSIAPESEIGGPPSWAIEDPSDLLQVDLRLEVPWVLEEPRPGVWLPPTGQAHKGA